MKKKSELKKKLELYKVLNSVPKVTLKHIIKHLDDESIDDICECVFNIIYTDLKLSNKKRSALKTKLHKHCCVKNLKRISNKKLSTSRRRKALMQEGEGIGLILSTVIPLLTKLFWK